jgi:hypothetical protein
MFKNDYCKRNEQYNRNIYYVDFSRYLCTRLFQLSYYYLSINIVHGCFVISMLMEYWINKKVNSFSVFCFPSTSCIIRKRNSSSAINIYVWRQCGQTIRLQVNHCSRSVALIHAIPCLSEELCLCRRVNCPASSPYGQFNSLSCARTLWVGTADTLQGHHVLPSDV